jgi:5-methylthioadenosine/S-adenosylhomocysteine deaminase
MDMSPVDLIIVNGTILTMDDHDTVIPNGFVAVQGDTIVSVGELNRDSHPQAVRRIDAQGGLILPGLVNAHTHAAMSLFRGLADDLPLMEWLEHYIFPVEQRMDPDFVHTGTLLACAEMILSGTTTFCDMYLFEQQVADAARTAGMRCLVGEVLYDFPSPNYGPLDKGFAYTESLIREWQGDPLVNIAVEPHAIYTCSPDLLQRAHALAVKHDVPLVMHVAETHSEVEQVQSRYGMRPFEHLSYLGVLDAHFVADHCVHVNEAEMDRMVAHGVHAVENPESNMKLASGVSPVPELQKRGIPVGLGTDGCASNNNLDLFGEMDTTAKLHKVDTMDPTTLDARTVLRMATVEGARVLGLGDVVGSIEKGKKADVIVVDTHKPHLTPLYNPFSHLVYAAGPDDVSFTIIDGQVVMENRVLQTLDVENILEKARQRSEDVKVWVQSQDESSALP